MTDVYGEYRRKTSGREDPRLARRDSKSSSSSERSKQQYDKLGLPISPKRARSSSSPSKDSQNWSIHTSQNQNSQYNSSLQTAYQHLPPALYTDHNQYSQGYSTSYTAYQQTNYVQPASYNPYQTYTQTQPTYNTGPIEPGPPGEEYAQNDWSGGGSGYTSVTQNSNHLQAVAQPVEDSKKDAVAQELKQQKAQMAKQREEYVRRGLVLRRELDLLRNQKQELLAEHSSEHDNNHILRENNKLQIEIQNKMKTINNVIEMLSNIIGDRLTISELEEQFKEDSPKHRREKNRRSVSTDKNNELESRFCHVYYDPEMHWCRVCDVFPKSAKDYLLHLHSKEHRQITQERDMVDTPWHRLPAEPELPSFEGAPKKRMPIKGLQFLISATAWYCKLCDTWVGDLHCASQHLKSQNHNQNFANFVEQNPHWEIEWLRDRDKAIVRISKDRRSDSEDSEKGDSWKGKKKDSAADSKKDKKKKKAKKRKKHSSDSSSSSSSSDSSSENESNDKSKSIRVAMRNKMKLQAQMIMNEEVGGKWEALGRLVEEQKRKEASEMGKESEHEDTLINQWMTVNEPQERDKRLFNNLKDRMKQKQEAEKARLAELEKERLKKEAEERELKEKKEREEQELKEKEAEKRRQEEELERQREKEREQIRFKPKEKPKKKSPSKSPEKPPPPPPPPPPKSPTPERKKRERSSESHRRDNYHSENGTHSSDRKRRSSSYDKDKDSPSRRRSYRDKRSNKKPHFIGRMPLFKNKKNDEKVEKEIKKEDYDIPRQSRFQPGNLARAFIPEPEVVCFPRLSSIPPLMIPPPPVLVPEPPKISEDLKPPPPPNIKSDNGESNGAMDAEDNSLPAPPPPPNVTGDMDSDDEYCKDRAFSPSDYEDPMSQLYPETAALMQYQYAGMDYNAMMYSQMYDYSQDVAVEGPVPPSDDVPLEHTMPLPPPPLPPDDPNEDLAMLGISADDMAAQMF